MSTSARRERVRLMPLCDPIAFQDAFYGNGESWTLRDLLRRFPALSLDPILAKTMDLPLTGLLVDVVAPSPENPVYLPPGLTVGPDPLPIDTTPDGPEIVGPSTWPGSSKADAIDHPTQIRIGGDVPMPVEEEIAVRLAYSRQIDSVSSFLRSGLSVLVHCDKLVVEYLWKEMVRRAGKRDRIIKVPDGDEEGFLARGLRQRQLSALRTLIRDLKENDVLVIPHLDLLAGGGDTNPSTETRELIELLYTASHCLVLAFADRSLTLPEVVSARFAARLLVSGVDRTVALPNGEEQLLGEALVSPGEAAKFAGYLPEDLFKNVAGMNPVRLRHAIRYAEKATASSGVVPVKRLYDAIRSFKVQTSSNFEVPRVTFKDDIGGYDDVKAELGRAIQIMTGSFQLPDEKLQRELIPRGFIFHGPPGTGKTLFAKAIANQLNATIQVVSGPEITDMYVGESERKVREIFAEARRNAPAVLVFDEFDSIATQRSGRDDGGSRAGNALVAQILTEMDGFRPDVAMLVIGTTNRLDIIDEALLRPSRFQAIHIGLPDPVARRKIAEVHAKHFKIDVAPELLDVIAGATEGLNGDEIRSLFRDACVGLYCENIPVDAHRLGVLVGRLRLTIDQRRAAASSRRTTGASRNPGAPPTGRPDTPGVAT